MVPDARPPRDEYPYDSSATSSRRGSANPENSAINFTWIDDTNGARRGRSRTAREHAKVRSHAAAFSAAARLASIKRKSDVGHAGPSEQKSSSSPDPPISRQAMMGRWSSLSSQASSRRSSPDTSPPWFILRLIDAQPWYKEAMQVNSINQKSTRAILWNSMADNTALWQSGYLITGTYSNTCGQPASAVHGISSGLIYLRGKALEAIHASLTTGKDSHLTFIAIAMLAAWERRFGDPEAFKVHMTAWSRSAYPPAPMEEENVDALMDTVWQAYREHLDSRSDEPHKTGSKRQYHYPESLPVGFRRFPLNRPETRSLLHLLAQYVKSHPEAPEGVARSRALRMENMAWSPSHTLGHNPGVMPCVAYEETWDGQELWALYHIRAALVSLTGHFGIAAHNAHKLIWVGDIAPGLEVHTGACVHLRTEDLMGGKYQEIALWAQFTMCSISRVPSRDENLKRWIKCCGIKDWNQMRALLERHSHRESIMGDKTENLYRLLTET